MNLSLYTGGVKPYLEYGWVCAPNTAGQSITANTITTLTIDTEVADTGNFGSIASNQITLAAGTYYVKAYFNTANNVSAAVIQNFVLFNVTDASYILRGSYSLNQTGGGCSSLLEGQITLSASKVLELRGWTATAGQVLSGGGLNTSSITTAGADQRTTIKLWKLA